VAVRAATFGVFYRTEKPGFGTGQSGIVGQNSWLWHALGQCFGACFELGRFVGNVTVFADDAQRHLALCRDSKYDLAAYSRTAASGPGLHGVLPRYAEFEPGRFSSLRLGPSRDQHRVDPSVQLQAHVSDILIADNASSRRGRGLDGWGRRGSWFAAARTTGAPIRKGSAGSSGSFADLRCPSRAMAGVLTATRLSARILLRCAGHDE